MSTTTRTTTRAQSPAGPARSFSGAQAVRLVVARELTTRLRTRSFIISNAVILALVVGGIVLASVLTSGDDDPSPVGVVGSASSLSQALTRVGTSLNTPVRPVSVGDEATARAQVDSGDLDVALVAGAAGGYRAITQDEVSPGLRSVLDTAVAQQGLDTALRDRGVDPAALASATAGAVVTVDAIDPPDPDAGQRTALAYVSVLLLYIQLLGNGIAVSTSVVEEKTSRVVELLLSTIKPLHLLAGKIIGIGIVGLIQLALLGGVGLAAGLATGLITLTGTAVAVFVSTLGWFVLGFAFFATLYAAAGSLVSRQEDVGSVTAPLTILVLAMFFVAQTTLQDPGGTVSSVVSWIPPFSAILMPLRIAAGVTGPVQVLGTIVLMVIATALLAALAARIYPRSVLRTGAKVSWRQALGRS